MRIFKNDINYLEKFGLLVLFVLLLIRPASLLAQDKKVIVELKSGSTFFFKNYPNSIELGFQGFCDDDLSIEIICNDCDSIINSEKYRYVIYSSKTRSVRLEFYTTNKINDNSEFISASGFRVIKLPDPSVMLGHYFSYDDVSLTNLKLKMFNASYPPSININARFGIVKWKVKIKNKVFLSQKSSKFSDDLINYLFNENKAKSIKVEVYLTISAPDGTEREICDIFTVYK